MFAKILTGVLVGVTALGLTAGSAAFAQGQVAGQVKIPAVVKAANLSVSMSPDQVNPGQRVRVSVTMVNTGNITISGATIIDRLPSDLKYVAGSANGELLMSLTPSLNSHGYLVWKLKPVQPGRQATVWFDVVPQANALGTRCTVALLDPTGLGHPSDSACVSGIKRPVTPQPVVCGADTHKVGNVCVPNQKQIFCGVGTHRVGNSCVPNPTPKPVVKPAPAPVQNQKQNQSQGQSQTQNNNQVSNVDVHEDNNNENNVTINLK